MTTAAVAEINVYLQHAPDTIAVTCYAYLTKRKIVVQPINEAKEYDDGVVSSIAVYLQHAPDTIAVSHVAYVGIHPRAAARIIGQNQYGFTFSSQRPQKSTAFVEMIGTMMEQEILVGLSVLARATRATDFASQTLADVTDAEVSFTLQTAKTVYVIGQAKGIVFSDTQAAESQFGFKHDSTDVVVTEWKATATGTDRHQSGATFIYPVSLAAGAHTLKLRAKTLNGAYSGNLVGPINLMVLG